MFIRLALSLTFASLLCSANDFGGLTKEAAAVSLSPELIAARIHWSDVAAFAPPRIGTPQGPTADNAASRNRRSKPLIILGAAFIGAGVGLMATGPEVRQNDVFVYRTRVMGGVFAAGGAVFLWQGLRKVH